MEVDFKAGFKSVTPVLYTGAVTADKMQLSDVFTLDGLIGNPGGTATLCDANVIDSAKLDTAFDVLFFSESPTVTSSKGSTLNISAAEMQKFIGAISFSSYVDLSAVSRSTLNAASCAIKLKAKAATKTVYGIIQSRGISGSAYGASGLFLNFKTDQD